MRILNDKSGPFALWTFWGLCVLLATLFWIAIAVAYTTSPAGVTPTVAYTEPTTYTTGASLTDLKETHIYWKLGTGVETTIVVPASGVAGGAAVSSVAILAPILPCQTGTIQVAVTAVTTGGVESARALAAPLTANRTHEPPCIPTAPTSLAAQPMSDTQVMLAWGGSTDDKAVTGYRVERCEGTCAAFAAIATPTGTTFTDTGRTANTFYGYRVFALDADGNVSPASNIANITTLPAPPPATPNAPTGITAQ